VYFNEHHAGRPVRIAEEPARTTQHALLVPFDVQLEDVNPRGRKGVIQCRHGHFDNARRM
jgi:hypothetical protein